MTAKKKDSDYQKRATVMNAAQLKRALVRMAHESIEQAGGAGDGSRNASAKTPVTRFRWAPWM
jgi:hypothetical protein